MNLTEESAHSLQLCNTRKDGPNVAKAGSPIPFGALSDLYLAIAPD